MTNLYLQRCPSCVWSQGIYPSLPGSSLHVFIAMQVKHSYTSSTNSWTFRTHVLTLTAAEIRRKDSLRWDSNSQVPIWWAYVVPTTSRVQSVAGTSLTSWTDGEYWLGISSSQLTPTSVCFFFRSFALFFLAPGSVTLFYFFILFFSFLLFRCGVHVNRTGGHSSRGLSSLLTLLFAQNNSFT